MSRVIVAIRLSGGGGRRDWVDLEAAEKLTVFGDDAHVAVGGEEQDAHGIDPRTIRKQVLKAVVRGSLHADWSRQGA